MAATMRLPEAQIRAQIEEAVASAAEIEGDGQDTAVVRSAYETWDKRNEILLERAFEKHGFLDSSPKDDYSSALGLAYGFGPALADNVTVEGLVSDVRVKVGRLEQILATLEVYGNGSSSDSDGDVAVATTIFGCSWAPAGAAPGGGTANPESHETRTRDPH